MRTPGIIRSANKTRLLWGWPIPRRAKFIEPYSFSPEQLSLRGVFLATPWKYRAPKEAPVDISGA
jgi:hypothetical protein